MLRPTSGVSRSTSTVEGVGRCFTDRSFRSSEFAVEDLGIERISCRIGRDAEFFFQRFNAALILAQGLMALTRQRIEPHQFAVRGLVSWITDQQRCNQGDSGLDNRRDPGDIPPA